MSVQVPEFLSEAAAAAGGKEMKDARELSVHIWTGLWCEVYLLSVLISLRSEWKKDTVA